MIRFLDMTRHVICHHACCHSPISMNCMDFGEICDSARQKQKNWIRKREMKILKWSEAKWAWWRLWIENLCTYYSMNAAILFCLLSQHRKLCIEVSRAESLIQKAKRHDTAQHGTQMKNKESKKEREMKHKQKTQQHNTHTHTRHNNSNNNRPLQCAFIITHRNLSEVFNSLHGIYSALYRLTRPCIFII